MACSPFFAALQALIPCLSIDSKKELLALNDLFNLFPNRKLSEIVSEYKKYIKARRSTPEGFCDRVSDFLNQTVPESGSADTIETLTADFKKLSAAPIKAIAKEFDINLSTKNDACFFENWLRSGIKPPTEAERIADELSILVRETVVLRDATPNDLPQENIERILDIANRIKVKNKMAGLVFYLNQLGYSVLPAKKTGPALLKFLRQILEDLAIARQKSAQIEEMGSSSLHSHSNPLD